jgi:hypothetical protein
VAEHVAEAEYKLANRHAKALRRVEAKLRTYRNLQDPLHDQKESCRRQLAALQKQLQEREAGASGFIGNYIQQSILQQQQKLEQLSQTPASPVAGSRPSTVHDVLIKLLNYRLTHFTLVIAEQEGVYWVCRRVRRTLIITLPQVQRLQAGYVLRSKQLKYLQLLGFRLYDGNDKLILFLPFCEQEHIGVVQKLFAQLVFEVFPIRQFTGKAYVKYLENDDQPGA